MNSFASTRIACLMCLWLATIASSRAQQPDPFAPLLTPPPAKQSDAKQSDAKQSDGAEAKLNRSQQPAEGSPDASAAGNQDNERTESQIVTDLLDSIEQDLDRQERFGEYGSAKVLEISQELTKEHQRNRELLEHGELDANTKSSLNRRQRLIQLYLWELKRVGATLVGQELPQNALLEKLNKLMRDHREAMKDRPLLTRVEGLMRRANTLRHQQMINRGSNRGFFFEDLSGSKPEFVQPRAPANPLAPAPKALASNGSPDHLSGPLRLLLKLGYRDGRLVLDRDHWAEAFLGKSLTDTAKDVAGLLRQRGVELPAVNNRNRMMMSILDRPYPVLLFENLQHAAQMAGGGSTSSGRSGNTWRKHFSYPGAEAKIVSDAERFDLDVRSDFGGSRQLRVISISPDSLKVTLLSDERIFLFDQKAAGPVRYVDVTEAEPVSLSASSFAEFYAQHPQAVEELLFPAFAEENFVLPPTRFDPEIVERVMANLLIITPETTTKFNELLEKVGSASFAARDRATRELDQNLEDYLPLVIDAYRRQQLPLEVSTRLKHVLQQYEREWRDLDVLISEMGLTSDTEYLIQLLPLVSTEQQARLVAQLQNQTSQDFGTNIDAWNNWLADR